MKTDKPNIRNDKLFSAIVVILFFGVFGFWAGFAPLDSAALAPGKIVVAGYRKLIQHLEGGIIKTIDVKDGTEVKENQVLMTLDNTQPTAALKITQNLFYRKIALRSRLNAELANQPNIQFPKKLPNTKVGDRIRELQQSIFDANRKVFNNNVTIYKKRIDQLQEQISGKMSQIKSSQSQIAFIEKELKDVRLLAKKRLVKQSRLLALEREAARLTGEQGEEQSQVAQLKQQIGQTQIEMNKLINERQKEILAELKDTRQSISELKEQAKAQQDILARTVIRSPISGVVVGLKAHTIGGVIKAGDTIMEIVPINEELIVEAQINPLDIDVVHPGLKAKVQITPFKQRTTPMLQGTVVTVSADAFINERTGQPYYTAEIKIPKSSLATLTDQQKLYPGMPVETMIITNQLTPFEYFVAPIQRSFGKAFRED